MEYRLCKHVMLDENARASYNALAKSVFGLSFEDWYQDGYWSDRNLPYTLFDKEKAVANISVNRMEVMYQGRIRQYVQLGTVMTDPDYRGLGLAEWLMEEVKKDFLPHCDAMFLFANRSVTEFYPKFGFRRQQQYEYAWNPEPEQVQNVSAQVQKRFEHAQKMSKIDLLQNEKSVQEILLTNVDVKRLNMSDNAHVCLLKRYYEKTNPFSKLSVKNNFNLLMFYLKSFMKDFVYYSKAADAVLVAEVDKAVLRCYDIYCDAEISLEEILKGFFPKVLPKVQFLFTPTEESTCEVTLHQDEDDVLFVWEGKENIFAGDRLLFPEISHT